MQWNSFAKTALLFCLVIVTNCHGQDLVIYGSNVVQTGVDVSFSQMPLPAWTSTNELLGKPDGKAAHLIIENGYNDWGEIIVDLGMELSRGKLLIVHRQKGPGAAKANIVSYGNDVTELSASATLGNSSQWRTTEVEFEDPVRYVRLYGGAGGGVNTKSVWSYDAVSVAFRLEDVATFANLLQKIDCTEGHVRSLSSSLHAVHADKIAGIQSGLAETKQQLKSIRQNLKSQGQKAMPAACRDIAKIRKQLCEIEQDVFDLRIRSRFADNKGKLQDILLGCQPSHFKAKPTSSIVPERIQKHGKIELAKGEYESLQLVVGTLKGGLKNVRVEVGPLSRIGSDESLSALPRVELGLVEMVRSTGGLWADPIAPLNTFDVPTGGFRFVWLRAFASEATPAGVYRCKVTVRSDEDHVASVPVEIKVRDFSLPVTSSVKTICAIRVADGYHHTVLSYRHNPGGGPCTGAVASPEYTLTSEGHVTIDWKRYDQAMTDAMRLGLNCFGLPWTAGDASGLIAGRMHVVASDETTGKPVRVSLNPLDGLEARQRFTKWLKDFASHLKEKGWHDKAIIYLWDEPGARFDKEIISLGSVIRDAGTGIPVMITDAPRRRLYPVVDIFVPLAGDFSKNSAVSDARREGKVVWWYNCGDPRGVSYSIPRPGIAPRVMYWLNWKYGVPGNLYWNFSLYGNSPYEKPGADGKGDGMLTYPMRDGKPVVSIRLEMIRDGIEDYEYLSILKNRIGTLRKQEPTHSLIAEAEKLLIVPEEVARGVADYSVDGVALVGHRQKIAAAIEKLDFAIGR